MRESTSQKLVWFGSNRGNRGRLLYLAVIVNVVETIGLWLNPGAIAIAFTVRAPGPVSFIFGLRFRVVEVGKTDDAVVGSEPSVV